MRENPEVLFRKRRALPRLPCTSWRVENWLVGETKGAPMDTDHYRVPRQPVVSVQRAEGGDSVIGIEMNGLHEPARLVRTHGNRADSEWTKPLTDARELRMCPGIASVKEAPRRSRDRESAPQRAIAVEWRARAEVSRRRTRDGGVSHAPFLPPVQFCDVAHTERSHEAAESQGNHPLCTRLRCGEGSHCPRVEMVVVVVREEDDVDRWKLVDGQGGRDEASRADGAPRGRPVAPDGIGENVERPELDEQRRMTDPGDRDFRCLRARQPHRRAYALQGASAVIAGKRVSQPVPAPLQQARDTRLGEAPRIAKAPVRRVMRQSSRWRDLSVLLLAHSPNAARFSSRWAMLRIPTSAVDTGRLVTKESARCASVEKPGSASRTCGGRPVASCACSSDALATTEIPSSAAAWRKGISRPRNRCVGARTASGMARLIGSCTTRKRWSGPPTS